MSNLKGTKTKIYSDVKLKVKAGNTFDTMKVIGYDLFRLYYDTIEKDCQVGSEKIKRVLKY